MAEGWTITGLSVPRRALHPMRFVSHLILFRERRIDKTKVRVHKCPLRGIVPALRNTFRLIVLYYTESMTLTRSIGTESLTVGK